MKKYFVHSFFLLASLVVVQTTLKAQGDNMKQTRTIVFANPTPLVETAHQTWTSSVQGQAISALGQYVFTGVYIKIPGPANGGFLLDAYAPAQVYFALYTPDGGLLGDGVLRPIGAVMITRDGKNAVFLGYASFSMATIDLETIRGENDIF